jgi:hypothetical protein
VKENWVLADLDRPWTKAEFRALGNRPPLGGDE